MTEYLTEQEQIELLKNWLKQYGLSILAGIVVAIIVVMGWRYYQSYRNNRLVEASVTYDRMLAAKAQNKAQETAKEADILLKHYAKTPYAHMAALTTAQSALAQKDYPQAIKHLHIVIDQSNIAALREIARIRLARIYLAMQKPKDALSTLNTIEDSTFVGLIEEIRGDAYLAEKNIPAAKESYQKALARLPNAEVIRPLLQMKYDNLA